MSRRTAARLAWTLWGAEVALVVGLLVSGVPGSGPFGAVGAGTFILAFATTGVLLVAHQPGNAVGWLLVLAAGAFTVGGLVVEVVEHGAETLPGPLVTAAAWTGTWVWLVGVGPAATFLLLLFPDGRYASPRWRAVGWLAGLTLAAGIAAGALSPGPIEDTPVRSNPLGVAKAGPLLDVVGVIGLWGFLVAAAASCLSLVVRYRRAGRVQRRQLQWVALSLPAVLVLMGASVVVESTRSGAGADDAANGLVSLGLAFVPVAMAVAMLRQRLYDIDVVINRTLVYGSLTALLAGVYLGSVLLLQLVLAPLTATSDLAVAASTLAAAALVRPARSRIQGLVDRRFFRRRYDAALTLDEFAARLRHEVDLEEVHRDLTGAVRETVAPTHVSLWVRGLT